MSPLTGAGHVVVIGAGQAGCQTVASLRESGHQGRITLIGDEGVLPYERPPLSKAYLKGDVDETQLWLRPEAFYERNAVERVTGTVVALDRAARTVRLADGAELGYDHLVLATGARARTLPVPGSGLRGVRTLRTLADADELRKDLASAAHVVIVGAGFIGLEFAASARDLGHRVTVVEALGRPLARALSARTAEHFSRLHRENGTELVFDRGVAGFHDDGDGRVAAVELTDGRMLPADLVLVGAGAVPCTELAEAAGLSVAGGIVTDSRLLTSDPRISAVGDCAVFPHPRAAGPLRIESVQNAVDHARLVADRLTGSDRTYGDLPWFWSTQFSTTLQIAGLGQDHDSQLVLGDPAGGSFSVLLFREEELVAVESVNKPADHMSARRLLADGIPLSRWEASAEGFTLRAHFKARSGGPAAVPVAA
ncbi:pyridine nucleotide-disulfide oxidoreductase [Streptomyces venezuelae]|uniref:Pyridine nucleotide-disulfide oxidoreductase n=1 Tax=Streptomyces venezuelae TaxID=54571 RepID=A0A5P2CW85_STRVZ|nr:FAD-dependent oxidoreductase [Streptomyces venezuelae]QES46703.1 pyridine nucleotide-disulfide oxidoreductase [Streptomyces venezuelae]